MPLELAITSVSFDAGQQRFESSQPGGAVLTSPPISQTQPMTAHVVVQLMAQGGVNLGVSLDVVVEGVQTTREATRGALQQLEQFADQIRQVVGQALQRY